MAPPLVSDPFHDKYVAVIAFFCQFVEGIIFAAAGYSFMMVLFFIDFLLFGYFIIQIDKYCEFLREKQRECVRLMQPSQARPSYHSTRMRSTI